MLNSKTIHRALLGFGALLLALLAVCMLTGRRENPQEEPGDE